MPALVLSVGERPDCQDVDFIHSDLDSPNGEVAIPVQPLLHDFFTE